MAVALELSLKRGLKFVVGYRGFKIPWFRFKIVANNLHEVKCFRLGFSCFTVNLSITQFNTLRVVVA